MRLLYFTRKWTDHDRRFVQAYCGSGFKTGVVFLSKMAAGIACEIDALGAEQLASLDLEAPFSSEGLKAVAENYRRIEDGYAPDVVVAGPMADCAFIKAAAATSVPWVAQSWAFDVLWEAEHDRAARSRVEYVLRDCEALFADCNAVAARCADFGYRASRRTLVVPWGLDRVCTVEALARSRSREALGIEGKQVFVYTRGFDPIYDPLTLVAAWKNAAPEPQRRHLLLLGDGSLRQDAEATVKAQDIGGSVTFVGRVPHAEVERIMVASDFYVSCSRCDGTSVSLLEALGFGLPPIITDSGGNPEWVSQRKNGWIVPTVDHERLAWAIIEAGRLNRDGRERIARFNARVIEARANWAENVKRLLAFVCAAAG